MSVNRLKLHSMYNASLYTAETLKSKGIPITCPFINLETKAPIHKDEMPPKKVHTCSKFYSQNYHM